MNLRLVKFWSLKGWTLFTTSRCTLRRDGTAWVRLGPNGPGLRVYDSRHPELPFSIRNRYVRTLQLGRFAFAFMPAVGRWP